MTLRLTTYRLGAPRTKSEGLRLGTTRYLPRGIPKSDYARGGYFDVWLPLLAPSRELLAWYRDDDRSAKEFFRRYRNSAKEFFRRYRKEMSATDPRQTIALLAELAKRTPLAVGCYCEDETRCHRTALATLIREAAAK
jgi:uncharacterized protein YeaO (DUF488 family)